MASTLRSVGLVLATLLFGVPAGAQAPKKPPTKTAQPKKDDLASWVTQVLSLPKVEEQVEAVRAKLRELNRGMDSQNDFRAVIKDGVVTQIRLRACYVQDARPLAIFAEVEDLACAGENGHQSPLADLSFAAGMKRLRHINLEYSAIRDLSPLKGKDLISLAAAATLVEDAMLLKDMANLRYLRLPQLKVVRKLAPRQQLDAILPGKQLVHFAFVNSDFNDSTMQKLKGMPLEHLEVSFNGVSDLKPLAGMPLKLLHLTSCPVTDIGPLAKCPNLEFLRLNLPGNPREGKLDLKALKGKPLKELSLEGRLGVTDISDLEGMKLESLDLSRTRVRSLAALREMTTLQALGLEGLNLTNLEDLRKLSALYKVGLAGTTFKQKGRNHPYEALAELPLTAITAEVTDRAARDALKKIKTLEKVNEKRAAEVLK